MGDGLKPIETQYHNCKFRSRLEARWAVFFDACGASWEYEPEGYDLDGVCYLPDFLIHGIPDLGDVYFEVKGEMGLEDTVKVQKLHAAGSKVIVVGKIPTGRTWNETACGMTRAYKTENMVVTGLYSWRWLNGEMEPAYPCLAKSLKLNIVGWNSSRWDDDPNAVDEVLTLRAYRRARQARFEHGEVPETDPIWLPA